MSRRISQAELDEALRLHKLWLNQTPGGVQLTLICCDASYLDFADANLTDADLTGANLTDADLTDANLTRADLTDAILTRANLTDADLTRANLTDADLTRADLTDAILTRADLTDANLTGTDLTGTDLDYAAWPLWCGSIGAHVDARIFAQLAYHLCAVEVEDETCKAAQRALAALANQSHVVCEHRCKRIEGEAA